MRIITESFLINITDYSLYYMRYLKFSSNQIDTSIEKNPKKIILIYQLS